MRPKTKPRWLIAETRVSAADLDVVDEFAECAPNEPRLGDVADNGRRQADQNDEQVGRRQIHYEQIRHRPHLLLLPDDDTDQRIAGQSTRRGATDQCLDNVAGSVRPSRRF